MSFLWRSNTQSETGTNDCKYCTDKDKRISDYEIFFNEMKDVLRKKEEEIREMNLKIEELNQKMDEQDIIIQSQIIFREKLIEEYETMKKIHVEEKRQWFEDRGIWSETKKLMEKVAMESEMEKSKYLETIEQLTLEKKAFKQQQKVMDENMNKLSETLNGKYNDMVGQMRKLELSKEEELMIQEEKLGEMYRNKIDELIEEQEKKEEEWRLKEEDYEYTIQRYQDNKMDYEMKIQEMKYDMNCERDDMDEKYKILMEERDNEWSDRIKSLNETYDTEFIQFKEHFKNKEQNLAREKEDMEKTLRYEIDVLKHENLLLEDAKRQMEKKRAETLQKWDNREAALISQIETLSLDNQRLEKESKEQSQRMNEQVQRTSEQVQRTSEDIQKKMQKECQTLREELERHQKMLKESIINVVEKCEHNKGTQTNFENENTEDSYETARRLSETRECDDLHLIHSEGIRQRHAKKKKQKRKHPNGCDSYNPSEQCFEVPYVETMMKNDSEKKTQNTHKIISYDNPYSNWNNDHVIDIDNTIEEYPDSDSSNFFLRIIGSLSTPRVDRVRDLENKIKDYEHEIETLKEQNKQYLSKIQGYECNTILELNRKIRSGIPVRFFPYTSSHGLSNTSHINTVDLDLH